MPRCIVTTSWDDGHRLDLKLVALLKDHGLSGTFYISKDFDSRLSDEEIQIMAQSQEIGAHTVSHANLLELSLSAARKEISESKKWLEGLIGKEVKMFCYPRGYFNDEMKNLVRQAGFSGARTTRDLSYKSGDPFEMDTTVHIYPFPFRKRSAHQYHWSEYLFQPLQNKILGLMKIGAPPAAFFSWLNLSKFLFDRALKAGGVYHLWGHSWEIERFGMWADLEKLCRYISHRKDCLYLNNSQALETDKEIE